MKKLIVAVMALAALAMATPDARAGDTIKIKREYYTPYGKVKVKEYYHPYAYSPYPYYGYQPAYTPYYSTQGYYAPPAYYPPCPAPYYNQAPYPYGAPYKVKIDD